MEKKEGRISSPEELNKRLQSTSFVTWLILGIVAALLIGLFTWSCIHELKICLTGKATINDGVATLVIDDNDLNKLKVGQVVDINNIKGEILSINEDRTPVVTHFELANGDYEYTIILEEKKPISFVFGN